MLWRKGSLPTTEKLRNNNGNIAFRDIDQPRLKVAVTAKESWNRTFPNKPIEILNYFGLKSKDLNA